MEHSYSKDVHPKGNVEVMATRSILIPRPPQCPSCYQHTSSDDILAKLENHQSDPYFDQLPPPINDNIAKMAMEETERLTKNVKNNNADDEDWDLKVNKTLWTKQQLQLYRQVASILDYDQLARLAVSGRPNEGVIRRCSIDKSVARMRLALASVHWNTELTQWLNATMFTYLPPTYMASYLDILQSLRAKVPTLVDKMLGSRPASFNQDYLQAIMKRPWGANVPTKSRKLPGQSPIIVIIPSTLNILQSNNQSPSNQQFAINSGTQQTSSRMKRWCSLLGTMASTAPIQHTVRANSSQSLESITEQLIAITRSKIQDLRNEMPNRHIILIGIHAGAAIAMQVALVETVSSIICMGFSFNTLKGARGAPDDKILEITTPVLFILGENSARSSQEEIESLRERMSAQTSLVVVGSADDALRINKFNRHLEGVTQSMVDNMIADEIQDFVSTCIVNPPGPRKMPNNINKRTIGTLSKKHDSTRKRKHKDSNQPDKGPPRKVGRPRLNREIPSEKPKPSQALLKQNNDLLKNVQNIVAEREVPILANEIVTVSSSDLAAPNVQTTMSNVAPNIESIVSTTPIVISDNGINLNVTQEGTIPTDKTVEVQSSPANVVSSVPAITSTITCTTTTSPSKSAQSSGQFVQLKPPTTTSRVQSSNVKNFFIRKGIEKNQMITTPTGNTIITTQGTPSPQISQLTGNKKIIIKSQQIIMPGGNVNKPATGPIIQVSSQQPITSSPASMSINNSVIDSSSAADLSGILDLPILFADNNDTTSTNQTTQILNTSTGSMSNIILNTSTGSTSNILLNTSSGRSTPIGLTQNILISTPDGKLPNRPVVISAAKVAKPTLQTVATTTSSSKVIFINRNQIKQQIVGSQTVTGTPIVKGLQTLKLVPTSLATSPQSTPITLQGNQIAKLSPATKIDLSTLKLVKNTSPKVSGNIVKPLLMSGTKNAFVIKPPLGTNVQAHPAVIKANVLNRNITVKKVNVMHGVKPITNSSVAVTTITSSPSAAITQTSIASLSNTSPVTSAVTPKTTRKTRSSN